MARLTPRVCVELPRTVYSLMYSPDGARLAVGGGFWYGEGYLALLDGRGRRLATCTMADLLPRWKFRMHHDARFACDWTISGVAFDGSGRWLACSTWGWRHTERPGLLFDAAGEGTPKLVDMLTWDLMEWDSDRFSTGVVFGAGRVGFRHEAFDADKMFSIVAVDVGVEANVDRQHLSSARVAYLGRGVITGKEARKMYQNDRLLPCSRGLVWSPFEHAAPGVVHVLEVTEGSAVTAITAHAPSQRLVSCERDGQIVEWHWQERGTEPPQLERTMTFKGHPVAIMAACFLRDGTTLATADGKGNVRLWNGDDPIDEYKIDGLSPRALAAHPRANDLAVGCKRYRFHEGGYPEGAVVILEVRT